MGAIDPPVPETDDRDPIRAVEIAAARGWPAARTAGHNGWLLRATPSVDRARSNSALPPPGGRADLGADLDAVIAWQQAHADRVRVMVSPLERHADLDAELERRGWQTQRAVDVLTAPLADIVATASAAPPVPVAIRTTPGARWLDAWTACEQRDPAETDVEAREVLTPLGARAAYALAGTDTDPHGVGIAVTVGDWVGLFSMAVHPAHRRRGIASALLGALAREARSRGARAAYLQVLIDNAPAQALYARHGFRRSHGYRTRLAPPSPGG